MFLLSAFGLLLSKYSRQDDIVIGVPTRRRTEKEFESIVGPFINNLPVRLSIPEDGSYESYLRRTHSQCIDDLSFDNLALDQLMSALQLPRDESRHQLISALFSYQETSSRPKDLGDQTDIEQIFIPNNTIQTDLMLWVKNRPEGYYCGLDYYCEIFTAKTISAMCQSLKTIVLDIVSNPQQMIDTVRLKQGRLPKLTFENNYALLLDRLEQMVQEHGDRIAIRCEDRSTNYKELQERLWAKSKQLQRYGVEAGDLVGIHMDRHEEMIITLLAVMSRGAGYVPLDPSYPEERLAYMIEQSGMKTIVGDSRFTNLPAQVSYLKLQADDRTTVAPEPVTVTANDIAYVIYTSGSTGKPKGVAISHQALGNFLANINRDLKVGAQDTVLGLTTISFDISILEMFLTLSQGATLALATSADSSEGQKLETFIKSHKVSVMQATPATWNMLLASDWQGFQTLPQFVAEKP